MNQSGRTDGRELYYRCGTAMMRVTIQAGSSFSAGAPDVLFQGAYLQGSVTGLPNYDVLPGGRQFVMISESRHPSGPTALCATLGWFAELARVLDQTGSSSRLPFRIE